jgi:hypothetical protein
MVDSTPPSTATVIAPPALRSALFTEAPIPACTRKAQRPTQ